MGRIYSDLTVALLLASTCFSCFEVGRCTGSTPTGHSKRNVLDRSRRDLPPVADDIADDDETATNVAIFTTTPSSAFTLQTLFSLNGTGSPSETLPAVSDVILPSGQRENLKNNALNSNNRTVALVLNTNGDLVIRRTCDRREIWYQVVPRRSDANEISMERNGNFAIYGPNGDIYWQTNTTGSPGADLRLQNNGFLCVFKGGRCIWSNDHRGPTDCRSRWGGLADSNGIILRSGETGNPVHDALDSPNGQFSLRFDYLNDLVVVQKSDNAVVWKQVVIGMGRRITIEPDGNLVVYGGDKSAGSQYVAWDSGTSGNPGADLRLENDGHLCVFKDGRCVWSNGVRVEVEVTMLARDPNESDVVMRSGQAMDKEAFVRYSALRKVSLSLDNVGDLVIRKQCDNSLIWWKIVRGVGKSVAMELNGNFVIYLGDDNVGWESGTTGNPGADLRLQDDGHLCVFYNGRCIWSNHKRYNVTCLASDPNIYSERVWTSSTTAQPISETEPDPSRIILRSGERKDLKRSQLQSPNKTAFLIFEANGDIEIRRRPDNELLWKQRVSGFGKTVSMELNGNLIVYCGENTGTYNCWETHTEGHPGADLQLEDDGRLSIYYNGTCIWENMEQETEDSGDGTLPSAGSSAVAKSGWTVLVVLSIFCWRHF